jgi:hypothetical protein
MKNDSGLSLVVSIIIVALAAIGGTTTYYFAQKDSISQTPKTTDVVLKETLSKKGVLLGDPEFTLIHVTDRFARAEIKDPQTGESKDTFLVLIKDEWKIVDITSEPVSCEKMEKIGFPAKMISDCLLDFPQAQTVADLENDINGDPIIEEPVINTDNVSENNNSTDSNQTYVNDSSDNNSDDYDVTVFPEPGDVIIPDDLYQNLLDIDNSDIEVEIISDF